MANVHKPSNYGESGRTPDPASGRDVVIVLTVLAALAGLAYLLFSGLLLTWGRFLLQGFGSAVALAGSIHSAVLASFTSWGTPSFMQAIFSAACQGAVIGIVSNLVHRWHTERRRRDQTGGPWVQLPTALVVGMFCGVAATFIGALSLPGWWHHEPQPAQGLSAIVHTLGVMGGGGAGGGFHFGLLLLLLLLMLAFILLGAFVGALWNGVFGPLLSLIIAGGPLRSFFEGRAKGAAEAAAAAALEESPDRSPLQAARHGAALGGWVGFLSGLFSLGWTLLLQIPYWDDWSKQLDSATASLIYLLTIFLPGILAAAVLHLLVEKRS